MKLTSIIRNLLHICESNGNAGPRNEPKMIASGWDSYAQTWKPDGFPVEEGFQVSYPGDEWTGETATNGSTNYGLGSEITQDFDAYLSGGLLDPYLPQSAAEGLEIGPGGGRVTQLLLQRSKVLHVAEPSEAMLKHLHERFRGEKKLAYYRTDGMNLPPLPPASLDFVVSFDVFVHFEPRLTFWYLRQIPRLLKPGGICIIHYSNMLTPIGWKQFQLDLETNVQCRMAFAAFGVMCPQLMEAFLRALEVEVVSTDLNLIPRDAIAVFRKS